MRLTRNKSALASGQCLRAAGILFLSLLINLCWADVANPGSSFPTNTAPSIHTATTNSTGVLELRQKDSVALTPEARTQLIAWIGTGANLDERDADNRTALTHAVMRGDLESVRILVQAGAHVKARDRFHMTPLLYAVKAGRRDMVDYLASNGDLQSPTPRERKERQRR